VDVGPAGSTYFAVEWESFLYDCSWTELHKLIITVVEYLIVN